MRSWRWLLALVLLAGCVAPPLPRPVPERSPLAVPDAGGAPTGGAPTRRYVPIVAGPRERLGRGAAVPHEYRQWGCQDAPRLGVGWLYDWGAQPPTCEDVVSVPMVWGAFDSKTCPALGPGRLALGFNEPDRPDQANITPGRAAALWRRLTVECYPERVWATPAVCGTVTYNGLPWLDAWWAAYLAAYGTPPRANYLAVHCFTWTTAQACSDRLSAYRDWGRAHGLAGMIVSEWAVLPGALGEAAALQEAAKLRAWLDAEPYVVGHAWTSTRIRGDEKWWFGPHNNTGLVDFATGELTAYGAWYAGD